MRRPIITVALGATSCGSGGVSCVSTRRGADALASPAESSATPGVEAQGSSSDARVPQLGQGRRAYQ
jgi:hypothetical protein